MYIQPGFQDILTPEFLYQKIVNEDLTQSEIAKIVGCSQKVISKYSIRYNIKPKINHLKKYQANEDYFKTWSSGMAYILGFLLCDGWIYYTPDGKKCLKLEIAIKDECVIDFIKSEISPTNPVKYRERTHPRGGGVISKIVILSIMSKKIVGDLADLYITQRKTGNERLPDFIPEEFKPDYIRGLIDGDGCICTTENSPKGFGYKKFSMGLYIASEQFLMDCKERLFFNYGTIRKRDNVWIWRTEKRSEIIEIGNYIYNGNFCLERKYNKFLEVVNYRSK